MLKDKKTWDHLYWSNVLQNSLSNLNRATLFCLELKQTQKRKYWHCRNYFHMHELPRKRRLRKSIQGPQERKEWILNTWRRKYQEDSMSSSAEGLITFGLRLLAWGILDPATWRTGHVHLFQKGSPSCRALLTLSSSKEDEVWLCFSIELIAWSRQWSGSKEGWRKTANHEWGQWKGGTWSSSLNVLEGERMKNIRRLGSS